MQFVWYIGQSKLKSLSFSSFDGFYQWDKDQCPRYDDGDNQRAVNSFASY